MIFADMGEGGPGPGVAPVHNGVQASGEISYGQRGGLLPLLPPNFAAVGVGYGGGVLPDVGTQTAPGGGIAPPGVGVPRTGKSVMLPTVSTTIPKSMTTMTTISTGLEPIKTPTTPSRYFPAPPPPPPPIVSDFFFEDMKDVGVAADQGAEKVGSAVNNSALDSKISKTTIIVGVVAALAASAGLYLVIKNR